MAIGTCAVLENFWRVIGALPLLFWLRMHTALRDLVLTFGILGWEIAKAPAGGSSEMGRDSQSATFAWKPNATHPHGHAA